MADIKVLAKEDAASFLGLSPKTLADARWRRRVGLHGVRVGGRLRFIENDLEALVKRGREQLPNLRSPKGAKNLES